MLYNDRTRIAYVSGVRQLPNNIILNFILRVFLSYTKDCMYRVQIKPFGWTHASTLCRNSCTPAPRDQHYIYNIIIVCDSSLCCVCFYLFYYYYFLFLMVHNIIITTVCARTPAHQHTHTHTHKISLDVN